MFLFWFQRALPIDTLKSHIILGIGLYLQILLKKKNKNKNKKQKTLSITQAKQTYFCVCVSPVLRNADFFSFTFLSLELYFSKVLGLTWEWEGRNSHPLFMSKFLTLYESKKLDFCHSYGSQSPRLPIRQIHWKSRHTANLPNLLHIRKQSILHKKVKCVITCHYHSRVLSSMLKLVLPNSGLAACCSKSNNLRGKY